MGDPLISAVVNYPRGPSYSVSPFIRVSRVISIIYANLCVIYAYFQLRQILGLFEAVCKYVALQVIYLHYNVLIYAN